MSRWLWPLRLVDCELNKETRIRRRSKIKEGKKKQASPQEVRSANSFLSQLVCVGGGGFP